MNDSLRNIGTGGVVSYKPLSRYDMEDAAAAVRHRPSGGVLFARTSMRDEKEKAREQILELFSPQIWPHRLHMLTMAGASWRFERLLLARRQPGWMRQRHPERTLFTSVENDRAIYFAGTGQIPGLHTPDALIKKIRPFHFAEYGIKTRFAAFFLANIDDMLAFDCNQASLERKGIVAKGYYAVWLDYTGPLTISRMNLISSFYRRYVKHILIITALKARWDIVTSNTIKKNGGYSNWLRQQLPGEILHDIEYQDTSPMAQFAIRKQNPLWFWRVP